MPWPVAGRWRARQEGGEPLTLARNEATGLARAVVCLRLTLAAGDRSRHEELTDKKAASDGLLRYASTCEHYPVHLSPDRERPEVTVLITPE
jgi:hypothetical protein